MAAFCCGKNRAVFLAVKTEKWKHVSGAKLVFTAFLVSYFIFEGRDTKYFQTLLRTVCAWAVVDSKRRRKGNVPLLGARYHKKKKTDSKKVHIIIWNRLQHSGVYSARRDEFTAFLRPPDILDEFWREISHAPFPPRKSHGGMNRSPAYVDSGLCIFPFYSFFYFIFCRCRLCIIVIIINPLTARVVGAPQMILQPVFSIFPCSPLASGTCRTPGLSIPWCCLPTSSFVSPVFFPLSLSFARWFWPDLMNWKHDHTTTVCVSLRSSGDLYVVQLPAGSCHGLPRW